MLFREVQTTECFVQLKAPILQTGCVETTRYYKVFWPCLSKQQLSNVKSLVWNTSWAKYPFLRTCRITPLGFFMVSFPASHSSLFLLRIWTLNMDCRFRGDLFIFSDCLFWFLSPCGCLKVVTILDNENTFSIVIIQMF